MDATLAAILRSLFAAHQELDQLRARVAELEAQLEAANHTAVPAPPDGSDSP